MKLYLFDEINPLEELDTDLASELSLVFLFDERANDPGGLPKRRGKEKSTSTHWDSQVFSSLETTLTRQRSSHPPRLGPSFRGGEGYGF